jgi:hemin uptake protein HemP
MRNTKPFSTATTASNAAHSSPTGPLRVDSTTLMGGQKVLEIVHQGEVYRLQTTRLGKLILTK